LHWTEPDVVLVLLPSFLFESHCWTPPAVRFSFADTGQVCRADENELQDTGSQYLFDLGDGFVVDAQKMGNRTRRVNHAAGDAANTHAVVVNHRGARKVCLYAMRAIKTHEELTLDYGPNFRLDLEGDSNAKDASDSPPRKRKKTAAQTNGAGSGDEVSPSAPSSSSSSFGGGGGGSGGGGSPGLTASRSTKFFDKWEAFVKKPEVPCGWKDPMACILPGEGASAGTKFKGPGGSVPEQKAECIHWIKGTGLKWGWARNLRQDGGFSCRAAKNQERNKNVVWMWPDVTASMAQNKSAGRVWTEKDREYARAKGGWATTRPDFTSCCKRCGQRKRQPSTKCPNCAQDKADQAKAKSK
jgi:hypothetical protein